MSLFFTFNPLEIVPTRVIGLPNHYQNYSWCNFQNGDYPFIDGIDINLIYQVKVGIPIVVRLETVATIFNILIPHLSESERDYIKRVYDYLRLDGRTSQSSYFFGPVDSQKIGLILRKYFFEWSSQMTYECLSGKVRGIAAPDKLVSEMNEIYNELMKVFNGDVSNIVNIGVN